MGTRLRYKGGDWYQIDDISGFPIRASEGRIQWDNLIAAGGRFSSRQPQDLVTGGRDDQAVPIPRPRQQNQFTVVATYVTAPAARGATTLSVASTVGFSVGNIAQVVTDYGEPFNFTISAIVGSQLQWTGAGLPSSVALSGLGDPPENQVINLSGPQVTVGAGQRYTGGGPG